MATEQEIIDQYTPPTGTIDPWEGDKNKIDKTTKVDSNNANYVTGDIGAGTAVGIRGGGMLDGQTLFYPQELFTPSQPNGIQFFINARKFGKDNTVQDMNGDAAPISPNSADEVDTTEQNRSQAESGKSAQAKSGSMLAMILAGYQAQKVLAGKSKFTKGLGTTVAAFTGGAIAKKVMESGKWIQNMESVRLLKSIQLHVPQSIVSAYTANWTEAELGIAGILGKAGAGPNWFGEGGTVGDLMSGEGAEFMVRNIIAGAANIPKAAGANADIGSLIEVTSKKVNNPYKEQLFKSMGFRRFAFNYVFSPRNAGEALMVRDIVKTFKYHMHPDVEEKGMFLVYPSEFAIEFMHRDKSGVVSKNPNLPRVSSCALTSVKVTYGPDGIFNTFQDSGGIPTETTMELMFTELETLTRTRIQEGL